MAYSETPTKGNDMINEMKTKINSTKKFVVTHKTEIAIAASFIAGGASAIVVKKKFENDDNTKLVITPKQLLQMRIGGEMHYNTELGEIVARFVETNTTSE